MNESRQEALLYQGKTRADEHSRAFPRPDDQIAGQITQKECAPLGTPIPLVPVATSLAQAIEFSLRQDRAEARRYKFLRRQEQTVAESQLPVEAQRAPSLPTEAGPLVVSVAALAVLTALPDFVKRRGRRGVLAKFAAVALLLAACAESTQAVNPTIAPPGITREVPTPASLIAPEPTDEPIPPTPVPTEAVTPTPDLRIQSVSIETARSFLGVALPTASEALASVASNTPYLADVYSEEFLTSELAKPDLANNTRALYQALKTQIQTMRDADGVGSLCGPDSLVFHNGRFGSYFRAMPLCITPDGSSMVWLQGFDGRLSSHASIAQGIDATRYSWVQIPLNGVRLENLTGVVNKGNIIVAAKDETKGGEILSKAYVTAEKQWVGAEQQSPPDEIVSPQPSSPLEINLSPEIAFTNSQQWTPSYAKVENYSFASLPAPELIKAAYFGTSVAGIRLDGNQLWMLLTWRGNIVKTQIDMLEWSTFGGYNESGNVILEGKGVSILDMDRMYPGFPEEINDVLQVFMQTPGPHQAIVIFNSLSSSQDTVVCQGVQIGIGQIAQECSQIPQDMKPRNFDDFTKIIGKYFTTLATLDAFTGATDWYENNNIPTIPSEYLTSATLVVSGGLNLSTPTP